MCFAHGTAGTFLAHTWVNAEPVPRFYPNVVTLAPGEAAIAEQRQTIDILQKSNLPGRWAVKDSFNTLDIARLGFDVLFEATWIRKRRCPSAAPSSDIVWQRDGRGQRRCRLPVRRCRTSRCSRPARLAPWWPAARSIAPTASWASPTSWPMPPTPSPSGATSPCWPPRRFPACRWSATSSGGELQAAREAGFEIGDPLRIWVKARD